MCQHQNICISVSEALVLLSLLLPLSCLTCYISSVALICTFFKSFSFIIPKHMKCWQHETNKFIYMHFRNETATDLSRELASMFQGYAFEVFSLKSTQLIHIKDTTNIGLEQHKP